MITNLVSWEAVRLLLPEIILVITVVAGIVLDLVLRDPQRTVAIRTVSFVGVLAAALLTLAYMTPIQGITEALGFLNGESPVRESIMDGMYIVWPLSLLCKLILLIAIGLLILVGREKAEFYYLLISATLGGMVLASTSDLVTMFVGLELLSITSYIMVALRKNLSFASEAGLKYVVTGGVSSALILYGMSFLYGTSGTTNIGDMMNQWQMAGAGTFDQMITLAFFLIIAGIGFKVATAPFHVWAPDVYQGANSATTAFLAVTSKAAGFFLLIPILYQIFYAQQGELPETYRNIIQILAAMAMIIGNIMALRQSDIKRMLAYSGVANSGYLLLPMAMQPTVTHIVEFFFYLCAYVIMNIGLFSILIHLQLNEQKYSEDEDEPRVPIATFAGLYHRAPGTAIATVILLLSLAGLPLTGGFMGKWFILFGAIGEQAYWLAGLLLLTSVISFYYYFGIIRQMFMRTGADGEKIPVRYNMLAGTWACVALTVVMGIFPSPVYDWIMNVIAP